MTSENIGKFEILDWVQATELVPVLQDVPLREGQVALEAVQQHRKSIVENAIGNRALALVSQLESDLDIARSIHASYSTETLNYSGYTKEQSEKIHSRRRQLDKTETEKELVENLVKEVPFSLWSTKPDVIDLKKWQYANIDKLQLLYPNRINLFSSSISRIQRNHSRKSGYYSVQSMLEAGVISDVALDSDDTYRMDIAHPQEFIELSLQRLAKFGCKSAIIIMAIADLQGFEHDLPEGPQSK